MFRTSVAALLASAVAVSLIPAPSGAQSRDDIVIEALGKSEAKSYRKLVKQAERAEKRLPDARKDLAKAEEELREEEARMRHAQEELAEARRDVAKEQARIAEYQAVMQRLETERVRLGAPSQPGN
ncbi:MAG: hypothetical protein V2J26_04425 [Pacificimonas sp.]|jgi:peptidoglycan hydrolase CwlO-like protein|nr:hypothetical protein [Pacificimonas sp.]